MLSTYVHLKSPMSGQDWMSCDSIAFTKVKLTNNQCDPKEAVRKSFKFISIWETY